MPPSNHNSPSPWTDDERGFATVTRNVKSHIPLGQILKEDDSILLVSPAVNLPEIQAETGENPFEPLGRAIHYRHPHVKHLQYTVSTGITERDVHYITPARLVVFVITGPQCFGEPSQAEHAQVVRRLRGESMLVIVACQSAGQISRDFPTVITVSKWSPHVLRRVPELLFPTITRAVPKAIKIPLSDPLPWVAEDHSVEPVLQLWNVCLPAKFQLEGHVLQSLLAKGDEALHFVIQNLETRQIVGFCANFLTPTTKDSDLLVGSIAALIVHPKFRRRGIGRSLHDIAVRKLSQISPLYQIQLGSYFPRLFRGVPTTSVEAIRMFKKRKWDLNIPRASSSSLAPPPAGPPTRVGILESRDLILRTEDWTGGDGGLHQILEQPGVVLSFRQARNEDLPQLQDFVAREPTIKNNNGWLDQYNAADTAGRVQDIVMCIFQQTVEPFSHRVVATALLYCPGDGSVISRNLPWAKSLGRDVGGVTCVCINAEIKSVMVFSGDAIMVRLLDTCISVLKHQRHMTKVYLDDVRGGYEAYEALGFQEWCTYRSIWRGA